MIYCRGKKAVKSRCRLKIRGAGGVVYAAPNKYRFNPIESIAFWLIHIL